MLLSALVGLGSVPLTTVGQTVQVTITCGDHGDVQPKGTQTVPAHSDLTITAAPDTGYEVYDWYLDGSHGGWTVNQIELHLGDLDVSVDVVFQRIINLVHVTVGAHGQLSPNGGEAALPVGWGDSVTFTATPDPHYHVDTWTADGQVKQTGGNTYVLPGVIAEHWVEVAFAPDTYTVQASAGPHGTLSPNGAVAVVYDDNQAFTATPNPGYDVVVWSLDGKPVLTNDTRFTLYNVRSNHTLGVSFEAPLLSIALTQTNAVLVSWPDALSVYTLQENWDLNTQDWTNSAATVVGESGRHQALYPQPLGRRFFRLTQP